MNSGRKHWLESWHVNPSSNRDYDLIDGLRGIAILMVVACHLIYNGNSSGPVEQFIGRIAGSGGYGVTVFFTLSGFLIAWPFWQRKVKGTAVVPQGYGWRRFWKIYPPLALSVLLLTPLYGWISHWKVAGQWLIGKPLVSPVSGELNPVMWSLVVEVHFYIVLPLLFLALSKTPAKVCWRVIVLGLLIVPGIFRWTIYHGAGESIHPEINDHFPSMLDNFALGVAMAGVERIWGLRKSWAKLGDLGFVLLAGMLVINGWMQGGPVTNVQQEFVDWGVKLAAMLLLFYIADPQYPTSRWLCAPWLRWCGIISYEWYLFHQPIFAWTRKLAGPSDGDLAKYAFIVITALVVGLVIGAVVYRFFSLPILKFGRSRNTAKPA